MLADRTPAQTAHLDQRHAEMTQGLAALIRASRPALDDLNAAEAAQLLAASIGDKGFAPCVLASYLAVAIVQIQRTEHDKEAPRG